MTEENNLKLRVAAAVDAETLADMGWQAFDEAFGNDPRNHPDDMKLYRDEYFSVMRIEADLVDPKIRYVIAELTGEIAGYAKIEFDSREECVSHGKTIELCRLYALNEFIGKGIGRALMLCFLEIAGGERCEIAWLGVWEFNYRAQKFYGKFGFEKVGEHIFQLGNDPQIDWILEKRLTGE